MKLAVTAAGPDLRAAVDPRFGRCEWFLIVDTDDMSLESIENTNPNMGGGVGIQSAHLMSEKGVKCVLTGHCGPNAYKALAAAGIGIVVGCSGSVREVIDQYKAGQLKTVPESNVPSHFGLGSDTPGPPGFGRGMGQGGGRGMAGGRGMGRGTGMQASAIGWSRAVAGPHAGVKALPDRAKWEPLPTPTRANPLTAKVNHERCTGCGNCVSVCPVDAIRIEDSKAWIVAEACAACGACAEQCDEDAIRLVREES